jgi:hypothetical protein
MKTPDQGAKIKVKLKVFLNRAQPDCADSSPVGSGPLFEAIKANSRQFRDKFSAELRPSFSLVQTGMI